VDRDELITAVIFNRVTNYTPIQKLDLYNKFKTMGDILKYRAEAEKIFHKPFKSDGEVITYEKIQGSAENELKYYRENDIRILLLSEKGYPEYLKSIHDPPLVIFARGKISLLDENKAIGIVGARKASNMSINTAYSIARDLARNQLVIVSGLASGIDYYAHKGALDGKGGTIAVLGNGIDRTYPKSSRDMYKLIEKKGLLLSEFPLGTEPLKYNFPKRNRIISGLAKGTLVVEASSRSGALITAGYALDQGREVMALPGRAGSESFSGNNRLIKEGAHLVENAEEICAILGYEYEDSTMNKTLPFTALECNILSVIGDDLVGIEDIERNLECPVSKIASTLTMLELKGAVIQYPGKNYSRVNSYGKG
jgi:DNA processing protein